MSSPHTVPRKPVPSASVIPEGATLSPAPSRVPNGTEIQEEASPDGNQSATLPEGQQESSPSAPQASPTQPPVATESRMEKQPQSQKPKKSISLIRSFNIGGSWSLELWSTILAFAAFAAIVVVLAYYNAKPQTTWPYKSLTLNGLVALLASIARASLLVGVAAAISQGKWNWFVGTTREGQRVLHERELGDFERFDDASRGAWGALQLLVRKPLHLASLGAITTVLLLGFDTFAQQIIAIRFRDDVAPYQSGLPAVPRSEYYDPSHFITQTSDYSVVGDLQLKSAVYNGIMNQNQTQLPLTCSTGNCTWPIIPTVAVCGACVDLTSNITKQCSSDYCNYTLPNGASLDGRITDIPLSEVTARRTFFRLWSPFTLVPMSRAWTNTIPDVPSYIALFQSLGAAYPAQDLRTVTAAECGLWLCLQSWNASVLNGVTSSQLLHTYTSARADSVFDYNFTAIPYQQFNIDPKSLGYGSSKASLQAIADSVNLYTYGNVTGFQMASVPGIANSWEYDPSSDTIQAFWQASASVDMYTSFVENFAISLSNNIRLTSPAPANSSADYDYNGTAYTSRAYVHVRWGWIAYPAAMTIASPAFVVLTVLQTRRRKVKVWKSSALVTLFTSVTDENDRIQHVAAENSDSASRLGSAVRGFEVRVMDHAVNDESDLRRGFWTLTHH
ncbi:hypothetical protein PV04_09020 [Phialophora macrospora]|uniref:DUF3176 domain containing protein n=1 Tax=Phialophora macrospora TaxID=1851006 RepID=A0A0D2FB48_9EURO|nr:hypothetical protein PV04_09020 [Phialophora macrospora]